jgi:hypothetical protein
VINRYSFDHHYEDDDKEEEILFIATAFGLATGGSSKGYAFRLTPPYENALVDSIDGYKPKDARSYWIYQRITTNWYLHYDYDD